MLILCLKKLSFNIYLEIGRQGPLFPLLHSNTRIHRSFSQHIYSLFGPLSTYTNHQLRYYVYQMSYLSFVVYFLLLTVLLCCVYQLSVSGVGCGGGEVD